MENLIDLKNDANSSLLINQNMDYLEQSYNTLLPQNPAQVLNQNAREVNMMFNSTDDNKNNANININISCQKMSPLYSDSNNDSNSQTDTSSKKIKEIKVKIPIKQKNNNNYINNNNIINDENVMKDTQSLDLFYSENERLKKIIYIQNWWKITFKIIFIQKYVRSYLIKRRISFMVYFIKNVYKILFKLVINNIKFYNNNNKKTNKDINHNKLKQNNNNNKNKKTGINNKTNKEHKTNSNYLFSESDNYCKKLKKILENSNNNNTMNGNKRNNKFKYIPNNNNNKERLNNKNKKINKDKKDKEINPNITNRAQIIANNIYNIYNNVKKYYENENNNAQATNKNRKNSALCNNNNKMKTKKMTKTGSMKNINEKNILNNDNPNKNINVNNNQKITKANKPGYSSTNNNKDIHSIINILKLKKTFLFWNMYIMKKIIIQKLKNVTKIKNVSNNKKKIPINKTKKKTEQKYNSINNKKINACNSVVELKLKKNTPQKKNIKESNFKQDINLNNYNKKVKRNINSVDNNNSMKNSKMPKSDLNNTLNIDKEIKLQTHEHQTFSDNLSNNDILIVNQYNRYNQNKKGEIPENINNNIDINENKKIFYFYAIINLIDKHNKRKKMKKYFNNWESLTKSNRNINNNKKIEEKIISFKALKSPKKNNLNNNNYNKEHLYNAGNYNCQTESNNEVIFSHFRSNSIANQQDLLTPNPIEKTMHPQLYKFNFKSSKIVYQKKFLGPKKMRNQSMNSKNINDIEEDRNMTLMDNNNALNLLMQNTTNNLYNINTYMINNNNNNDDLNNTMYIKRNNYRINDGIVQGGGRVNTVNGNEDIYYTPATTKVHTSSFIESHNFKDVDEFNINNNLNNNNITINVIENYSKIDTKKDNNINKINYEKPRITTKQINLKSRKYKNISHSQEFRNDNQELYN